MTIEQSDEYKKLKKKLGKFHHELDRLELILAHIRCTANYQELKENPISIMYGFEHLKYELNGFHSFNLCKSRQGTIRLIIYINEEINTVRLVSISFDHYTDFKRKVIKDGKYSF